MFSLKKDENPMLAEKLCLPYSIARTVAQLVTMEMECTTDLDLKKSIEPFMQNILLAVTEGLLQGEVIFKPYLQGDALQIMLALPKDFTILERNSAGVPLVTEFYEQRDAYVRVERHTILSNEYVVTNSAMYKGKVLENMPTWWRMYEKETRLAGVSTPLFGYFATADHKPFCTAAMPLIQEAEKQFERILWEFESGERALYVADTAFFKDRWGKPRLPSKRLYRLLASGKDDLFCDYSPAFRQADLCAGLNCILQRIEDCCSLARGTFSDANEAVRTATELKLNRQRTYATVKCLQQRLENAICDMVRGVATLLQVSGLRPHNQICVRVGFDDAVLTGKTDEISDLMTLIDHGVLEPAEVKAYLYGETKGEGNG